MKSSFIILCALLASCNLNDAKYEYHSRTKLCFLTMNLGWNNGTVTNVPCTKEVMDAVLIDSKR